jgi:hypothetical protein
MTARSHWVQERVDAAASRRSLLRISETKPVERAW